MQGTVETLIADLLFNVLDAIDSSTSDFEDGYRDGYKAGKEEIGEEEDE